MKDFILEYSNKINFDFSKNDLGEHQLSQLIYVILDDYMNYKISPDDLETYLVYLFEIVIGKKGSDDDLCQSRPANMLWDGLDLSWELRNNPEIAGKTLQKLIDFYNNYKASF